MTNMTPEEIRRYSQARYEAIREVEATTAEKQAGAVVEVFRALYEVAAQVAELNVSLKRKMEDDFILSSHK